MNYDRRHFLKLAAGVAASAAFGPVLWGATASGPDLGFSLYGMKKLPLSKALSECARIGYRNVELSLLPGFPTELARLGLTEQKTITEQVASLGLSVSSLLVNLNLVGTEQAHSSNLETIRTAGLLARSLSPQNPPLLETVLGGGPQDWEPLKTSMAERLHDWGEAARSVNATIAVKAHVLMAVNSPERLLWLLHQAHHNSIVLTYDYSHFSPAGVSLEESWRALAPYTRFVHVKDSIREGSNVRFLLPGEGQTDYGAYFQMLRNTGYRGPVVVEVSSQIFSRPGYDPILAAEKSYSILASALATTTSPRP